MSRLVIVSNRVGLPNETRAGGLAMAMRSAIEESGKGLWFGWSGNLGDGSKKAHHYTSGMIDYALVDLTPEEYDDYYLGFANGTLWPLLHFRSSMMHYSRAQYAGYRAVNKWFAQQLAPLLRPDDLIWVQDYHLIPLASELRALGIFTRIGFFLHIPMPPPQILVELPCHADLLGTLLAYDLVGLQTPAGANSLRSYFSRRNPARVNQEESRTTRCPQITSFPIGIDTASIAEHAETAVAEPPFKELSSSMSNKKMVIGVDRLDYSKGIPQRLDAFGRFLAEHEEWHNKVSMLQIAPLSREQVPEYKDLRLALENIVGATNGQYALPDWTPIRYVNHCFPMSVLSGFYRMADLALVTPLRDGMNLVAKEFIAAQDADDPGVLVLSRFAGAAEELPEALLVNPHDPEELVEGMNKSLAMPLNERKERWAAMFDYISANDITTWRRSFLHALEGASQDDVNLKIDVRSTTGVPATSHH